MTNPKIEAIKNQIRGLIQELPILELTDLQYALDELSDEAATAANQSFDVEELCEAALTW